MCIVRRIRRDSREFVLGIGGPVLRPPQVRQVRAELRFIRLQPDRIAEGRGGLVQRAPTLEQDVTEVGVRGGVVRVQRHGPAELRLGLRLVPLDQVRAAEVEMGTGAVRLDCDGLP